jgi:hypothetical protein
LRFSGFSLELAGARWCHWYFWDNGDSIAMGVQVLGTMDVPVVYTRPFDRVIQET